MALGQVCGVIDALADFQQRIIDAINNKFAALRRLAELLEALADLTGFIPDISKLIPISSIDLSVYETLRAQCPFLKLPPAEGDPEQLLGMLRAEVNAAYGALLGKLNLHPLSRLSKLQEKLDDYQQRFNVAALGGTDFMACLQAACQAAVAVEGTVSNLSNTSASKVAESAKTYLKNTVTDQGKVLSSAAQGKVNDWDSTRSGLKKLMNVETIDLPTLPTK
ncbi:MAG: hypothetical protein ACOYB3_00040 [Azonexus sp.]